MSDSGLIDIQGRHIASTEPDPVPESDVVQEICTAVPVPAPKKKPFYKAEDNQPAEFTDKRGVRYLRMPNGSVKRMDKLMKQNIIALVKKAKAGDEAAQQKVQRLLFKLDEKLRASKPDEKRLGWGKAVTAAANQN